MGLRDALAAVWLLVPLLLALVVLAAAALAAASADSTDILGGAPGARRGPARPDPARSPHLVVDTLNLTHWLGAAPSAEAVVATIDRTAAALRARHPGRVLYVLKDRESRFNDDATRAALLAAAQRNRVGVLVAERYPDPPAAGANPPSAAHAARGRDDFLMAVLAARYKCAVLTEDRLRDFAEFRSSIPPFHVYEFAPWRDAPLREYYRPESAGYRSLRKPRTVRYADYLGGKSVSAP